MSQDRVIYLFTNFIATQPHNPTFIFTSKSVRWTRKEEIELKRKEKSEFHFLNVFIHPELNHDNFRRLKIKRKS